MNEIELFSFKGHEVRTVVRDGEPWFVAADVAKALRYSNSRQAVASHVDTEDKGDGVQILDAIGRAQTAATINESGVYALIFGSEKPEAKAFKRWVTGEVLPTLRNHGVYVDPSSKKDDAYIEAEVQRQLQKRQYKVVVRDNLKAVGAEPGWQYGEVHNIVLRAVCGMKAPELLASGRELQSWPNERPRKADMQVATNFLFADELELFNIITDAVSTDLRFRKPQTYRQFVTVVRDAAERYTG